MKRKILKTKFYSREDCPLCEDIEEKLAALGCVYEFIDIDSSQELLKKYHVSIPVLQRGGKILKWPFSDEELKRFVNIDDSTKETL